MKHHVIVTGATGLVGTPLVKSLTSLGHTVTPISRKMGASVAGIPCVTPVDVGRFREPVVVVHLAGANVMEARWSDERKARLEQSRCQFLREVTQQLHAGGASIRALVGASAVGIYQTTDENVDGAVEADCTVPDEAAAGRLAEYSWADSKLRFAAYLCRRAEETYADLAAAANARRVTFRIGLVMSRDAITWTALTGAARWGLGATLGSGQQWLPLVHRDDLVRMIVRAVEDDTISGTYNAAAPGQLRSCDFTRAVAAASGVPYWLPSVPAVLPATILGERWSLLSSGVRMDTTRWQQATSDDFFTYPTAKDIIKNLL